jgi:myo-inositol-1(or 4)-monophosphatase
VIALRAKDQLTQAKKQKILQFVERLARAVGDKIARQADRHKKIAFKGEIDLVTQFDHDAQDMILRALRKAYPDFGILSEEDVREDTDRPVKWIVDPLDGTTNFAHGLPIWAISIALEVEGDVVAGVVYDPNRDEMFTSTKRRGAWLNHKRIYVSNTRKLGHSLLVTGFPYDIRRSRENNLLQFNTFAVRAQAVRRLGSAALDLCYTACGRFDGYWEMKLSPWDQAAGSLILLEAGGRITDFQGKKFDIYGNEVLGTNGKIHRQMISVLGTLKS